MYSYQLLGEQVDAIIKTLNLSMCQTCEQRDSMVGEGMGVQVVLCRVFLPRPLRARAKRRWTSTCHVQLRTSFVR